MSTENKIIIGGATQPSTINTPGDIRERVATFEEIYNIDNPAVGGTVWVEDEQKEYRIISLKSKIIGGMEIENGAVNEVVPEAEIISRSLNLSGGSVADAIASDKEAVTTVAEAIAQDGEAVNTVVGAIAQDEEAVNTLAGAISKTRKVEGDTLYL